MAASPAVRTTYRSLSAQACALADRFERGQAEMPLRERFEILGRELDSAAFTIALLGLDAESRAAALSWMCAQDHRVFHMNVTGQVGLFEICLQEHGYSLSLPDGQRFDFERLDPFLSALARADLLRDGDRTSWAEPVRLLVEAPPAFQGLRVLVPENAEVVLESPALLSRIVRDTNVLVVAARADHRCTAEQTRALEDLCTAVDYVVPVVLGVAAATLNDPHGWWHRPPVSRANHLAAPACAGPEGATSVPGLLVEAGHPVREALFVCHAAGRLDLAVGMLAERHEDDVRLLQTRLSSSNAKARLLEDASKDKDLARGMEELRELLRSEASRLAQEVDEWMRRATLPNGAVTLAVRRAVDDVDASDLRSEIGARAVQLTVDERALERITNAARNAVRAQMHECAQTLGADLGALRSQIGERVGALTERAPSFELKQLEEAATWDAVRALVQLELRYRAEMPKRSILQRLSEGRRPAYALMMVFSTLAAGMLTASQMRTMRAQLAVIVAVLFVGGFVWTFVSWRREDRARMDAELIKVRDGLFDAARRLVDQAQREIVTRLQRHVADSITRVGKQIEICVREASEARAQGLERNRRALRDKLKLTDQHLRELLLLRNDVAKLQQGSNELRGLCRKLLADEVARAAATKTA